MDPPPLVQVVAHRGGDVFDRQRSRRVARAYRAYVLAHPNLYRLINDRPLPRHLLPEGLEAATSAPLVAVTADGNQVRWFKTSTYWAKLVPHLVPGPPGLVLLEVQPGKHVIRVLVGSDLAATWH